SLAGVSCPTLAGRVRISAFCVVIFLRMLRKLVSDLLIYVQDVAGTGNGVVNEDQRFRRAAGGQRTDGRQRGFLADAALCVPMPGTLHFLEDFCAVGECSV